MTKIRLFHQADRAHRARAKSRAFSDLFPPMAKLTAEAD